MITLSDGVQPNLQIRSPLLDDAWDIKSGGTYRRSRDHSLYGYSRTPIQTLTLRFADFNRPQINALVAFLKAAAFPLQLTLDNGNVWTGTITNDFESQHVGHADNQFTLVFEGTQ